jgi:hypothetical protein
LSSNCAWLINLVVAKSNDILPLNRSTMPFVISYWSQRELYPSLL